MSKESEPHSPASGTESTAPSSSQEVAGGAREGFREPLGENAVERLRSYQVMTIPPSARRALMSAELPGASPELLYDTLPPNRAVVQEPDDTLELEAPVVPPARKQRLRGIVTITAAVMLAIVIIAWLRRPSEPPPQASTVAPNSAAVAAPLPAPRAESTPATPRSETAPQTPPPAAAELTAPPVRHPAERPIEPSAPRISATAAADVPTKKPSVSSALAPSSPQAAEPANVAPPTAPEGAPRKGFRLGSR